MEDLVIPDVMNDVFLPQGRYPENFVLISQLEEGQEGGGGQEGGYLEDIDDSWPETWRKWSSLMLWMMFFYLKEDNLRVSCLYLYWKCIRKGGLGGH